MKIEHGVMMNNYIQRDVRALTKPAWFACVCQGHARCYGFINKGSWSIKEIILLLLLFLFFTRGLYDKSVIKQQFGLTFRMTFEVNMIYLYTLVIFYSL